MREIRALSIVLMLLATIACSEPTSPETRSSSDDATGPLVVYVVNYPLQYFAERIGGEHVEVSFPAPADVDPAYWSPDADTVASYQQADLILLNGAGYAGWVARASLPEAAKVDTSAALADRFIALDEAVTHAHGPEGEHAHGDVAFTTWLDLSLAIEQARAVSDAFAAARSEHAERFRTAFNELAAELTSLDQRLQALAQSLDSTPLLFSHPVYQYMIRRYELNGRSLHWEPDQSPDLDELARVREEHAARWMIWEGAPLPDTVEALADVGVSSLVVTPCGRAPLEGDLISLMEQNIFRLEAGPGSSS